MASNASNASGMDAAWASWSDALVATLFPAGLGAGQSFAFGQTTLVADFANSDPLVVNAEAFRIGDMVAAASPAFTPLASLSDAYGFFLQRLDTPALAQALANWSSANSSAPTAFNMPARTATQVPAGAQPGDVPEAAAGPTTCLPSYLLDAGFRGKYQEWQAASIAVPKKAGAVIRVSAAVPLATAPAAPPPPGVMKSAAPGSNLPPFVRLMAPATAALRPMAVAALASPLPPPPSPAGNGCSYTIDVSFTGLGTFMLGPGRWFSDTAVRLFAGQLSAADQAGYFGPAGVLARRTYQVVLGFEATVSMNFSGTNASGNAKALLAQPPGRSLGIGPLSFDTGSLAAGAGDDTTVTLGPAASTLPILLGVVSTDLANFPAVT